MAEQAKPKMSDRLQAELESKHPGEPIDLLIALSAPEVPASASSSPVTRGEAIAAIKESFDRKVATVAAHVSSVGGVVLDSAWINSTVRTRIPVEAVQEFADDEQVEGLDIPSPLEAEA